VYSIATQITLGLLDRKQEVADWRAQHNQSIGRLKQLLTMVSTQTADLAPVSVALREMRQLA